MAERKELSKDVIVVTSEEFPSNSHKSKEEVIEKRVTESVVKGKVKKKKKSLGRRMSESFLEEDSSSVFSYILNDVLLPAAKDTLSDMVNKSVEMFLYGSEGGYSSRRSQDRGNRTRVNYSSYYERDNRDRFRVNRRASHNFDDILFDDRNEAEEVLTRLCDLVYEYGEASVQDFYDLVGMTSSYTDQKWGWTNLSTARVVRTRDGFAIRVPRVEEID